MAESKLREMIVRVPADLFHEVSRNCRVAGISRNKFVTTLLEEALPDLANVAAAVQVGRQGAAARTIRVLRAATSKVLTEMQRRARRRAAVRRPAAAADTGSGVI